MNVLPVSTVIQHRNPCFAHLWLAYSWSGISMIEAEEEYCVDSFKCSYDLAFQNLWIFVLTSKRDCESDENATPALFLSFAPYRSTNPGFQRRSSPPTDLQMGLYLEYTRLHWLISVIWPLMSLWQLFGWHFWRSSEQIGVMDEFIHWPIPYRLFFVSNLWWNIVMDDWNSNEIWHLMSLW